MNDADKTLAVIREDLTEGFGIDASTSMRLLSAVENVLALCDEYAAQARGDTPDDRLRQAARKAVALRFRKAITDAIGGDL